MSDSKHIRASISILDMNHEILQMRNTILGRKRKERMNDSLDHFVEDTLILAENGAAIIALRRHRDKLTRQLNQR